MCIQWNELSQMFKTLSNALRALGDIMHKNIESCKQCSCESVPNYLLHISLILNSQQTGITGKPKLLNELQDCAFCSSECSPQAFVFLFSCIAKYVEQYLHYPVPPRPRRQRWAVRLCVGRDGILSMCESREGNLSTPFSHLSPAPHTTERKTTTTKKACSGAAHRVVQTCPRAGTAHTNTNSHG